MRTRDGSCGRLSAMRTAASIGALVSVLAGAAHAAPIAAIREDVDGDGAADAIELAADGTLSIGGAKPAQLRIGAGVTAGRIAVGRTGATLQIVVQVTSPGREEAVVVEARAGWREVTRFALGGVGLDREYGIEVEATQNGVVRYQTTPRVKRCDGKPAYLFAERLEGAVFRPLAAPPANVPPTAVALPARLDAGAAAAPLLYQARAASHQPGASDASALGIPAELDDGKPGTVWREELATAGEGQFFTFQPRVEAARAQQIRVVPGNPASAGAMRAVNRPRGIAIVAAQGAWRVELPDAANEPLGAAYVVDLPQPVAGCVTIVLETTHGRPQGATAIAELEVFAEGERTGGGAALLARAVAEGKTGATAAAATLARQGAAGAAAIDTELA